MHDAAYAFISGQVATRGPFVSVLEVGSRDINGTVRGLFDRHNTVYEGVDIVDGPGVDYVCDATVSLPTGPYDCAVCCEVFEHLAGWPLIVGNVHRALMDRGVFMVTAAGPGRAPHSAVDGGPVRGGEFYENVDPDVLRVVLDHFGFVDVVVDVLGPDVRAVARKGG